MQWTVHIGEFCGQTETHHRKMKSVVGSGENSTRVNLGLHVAACGGEEAVRLRHMSTVMMPLELDQFCKPFYVALGQSLSNKLHREETRRSPEVTDRTSCRGPLEELTEESLDSRRAGGGLSTRTVRGFRKTTTPLAETAQRSTMASKQHAVQASRNARFGCIHRFRTLEELHLF